MKTTPLAKKPWWASIRNWLIVVMALVIVLLWAVNMSLAKRLKKLKAQAEEGYSSSQVSVGHSPTVPKIPHSTMLNRSNKMGSASSAATKIIFKEGDYYRNARDIVGMKEYLKRYPKGEHAVAVQQQLVVMVEAQNQTAPIKEKVKDLVPAVDMVAIPAGNFTMGDTSGRNYGLEQPAHTVYINGFSMSKFEITFAQYDEFLEATGSAGKPRDAGWGRGNRPVINVSWDDARVYAKWLSEQTGRRYRLPTEAEWEYAARAMTTSAYSWGNLIGCNLAQYRDLEGGCNADLKRLQTMPVGSFHPNAFGLFDMHGNVYEWVEDCAHADYTDAPSDGSAWVTGACLERVLRGGSWAHYAEGARSATRYWLAPYFISDAIGFRVVSD